MTYPALIIALTFFAVFAVAAIGAHVWLVNQDKRHD